MDECVVPIDWKYLISRKYVLDFGVTEVLIGIGTFWKRAQIRAGIRRNHGKMTRMGEVCDSAASHLARSRIRTGVDAEKF
jgi:hypothetical protein